jgi:hypothetical protein
MSLIAPLSLLLALAADCRPGNEAAPMGDLDGDGVAEVWTTSDGSGSQMAGTSWSLTLSQSGQRISGVADVAFGWMLNGAEVPPPLLEPGNERIRAAVEHRLFSQVCDAPDPSLAWLLESLSGSRALRWHAGLVPKRPTTHTLLVRDRRLSRAIAPRRRGVEGRVRSGSAGRGTRPGSTRIAPESKGAIWVTYLGDTHLRSGIVGDLDAPRTLIERPGRELLATHHGLILVDTKAQRHAWVWVTRSNFKLRFRSICPAARVVARDTVEVAVDPHSPYDEGDFRPVLRVELSTGRTKTATRRKDESWTGCQAESAEPAMPAASP